MTGEIRLADLDFSALGSSAAHGTKRLSQDDLDRFSLPLPDLKEQKGIADILDAVDHKIDLHRRKKVVLEELFRALVRHAAEIGWVPLAPEVAKQKRGGEAGMFLLDELSEKLIALNPGLVTEDNVRQIIDRLEALPTTIEGNRDVLGWLRGERQIYDETEKRYRRIQLIDFDRPAENVFHVSWEWALKPPPPGRR